MFHYDLKFLTTDDSVHVKNGDLKTFKYETKKKQEESIYDVGKRSYCERRGEKWRAPRPRLIRELESNLRDRNVVLCEWTSNSLITIVFSSGILAYISVNPYNSDITQILFDKFCVGKLSGQIVTSVVLSKSHLLFMHMDRMATLVSFGTTKPSMNSPNRISDRVPHIQTIELGGGTRRAEHHISWCDTATGLRILTWSTATSEPAPWSPVSEDRANLHLYLINGTQINLIGYHQLENETLSAELSRVQDNIVHIVEQVTYQMNGVSLEWLRYELATEDGIRKLATSREGVTQVSLSAPARAVRRSECETRLLVGCIDGTLHVVQKNAGLTHSTRASFIPTEVCWAGALIIAVEERGRLQCFDRALSLLQHHSKCIDLAQHLRESRHMKILAAQKSRGGSVVLASFSGGPLALLRIMHPQLLTGWIRSGRPSRAISLLRALDWESEGEECLRALQQLVHTSLRRSLHGESEATVQMALGAYLAPEVPLSAHAQRHAPAVHDLARKFFHHLLRRGRVDKSLSLAVDLGAWDLFADVRWAAVRAGQRAIAEEAHSLALQYATRDPSDSSCSASCSQCSSRTCSGSEDEPSETNGVCKIKPPPLPRVQPPPTQPTLMPVPVSNSEPISTNSIRPNLHQYLERDLSIWNTETVQPTMERNGNNDPNSLMLKWHSKKPNGRVLNDPTKWRLKPTHTVVDVIPRPQDERLGAAQYGKVFQKELTDEVQSVHTNMYRYHNDANLPPERAMKYERGDLHRLRPNGERNKVKFSDTVTIAVVSEEPRRGPSPARELAESLPLCAPHAYLAAFAPHSPPAPPPARPPPGTPLDYVEV